MSKECLKESFVEMQNADTWSLQLLKISSSTDVATYYSRQVELNPEGKIKSTANDLVKKYLSSKGIDSFSEVEEYTGDVVANVIYKFESDNSLINKELASLLNTLANPNMEDPIEVKKYQAYVLLTNIKNDNEMVPVKLISMQCPVSNLTNKFILHKQKNFHEIKEPVLTLKRSIDVIILGKTVYMLTLDGENLFAMERAYKSVCQSKVEEIIDCGFITDPGFFKSIATSGHNPRRFVSYNQTRLDALKDVDRRNKLAQKFEMRLNENKIDTVDKKTSERLVKFLCNKAMLDPLDESPIEVSAAKRWQ